MSKLELIRAKIKTKETLPSYLNIERYKTKKIVFTNGCFDIVHRGHLEYLAKASEEGDTLIVGLNSDESVRRLKGNDRPLQDQDSRALLLASLHFVSAVVVFDEDTPLELIKFIKPHVLIKGSDYRPDEIVGADVVKANGGEIKTVDLTEGYSTSRVVEKIKPVF